MIYYSEITPDSSRHERTKENDIVLVERFLNSIDKFNPYIHTEAKEEVLKKF